MIAPYLCLDFDTTADIARVSLDTNTNTVSYLRVEGWSYLLSM